MQPWLQDYNPTGSPLVSTLLAATPIVVLLGLLGLRHWPAHRAAIAGLVTALALATIIYGMPPASAAASAVNGALFGLFPIGWIILPAVLLFTLTVETGEFEIVKASVAAVSPDRRMQAMLVAFSFGAFIEGCAGFGAPVAITSALLIGAGFPPLYAAGLSLIANTAPVAFGSLGIPITTMAAVTGLDEFKLGVMAGRQLPFFSLIIPGWMVFAMGGWRAVRGVWPAIVVCGGTFAVVQFLVSNYVGPKLVDVASGGAAILALTLMSRLWQPRQTWRFNHEPPPAPLQSYTRRQIARAWTPWLLLSLCVVIWSVPQLRTAMDGGLSDAALAQRTASPDAPPLKWWERPNVLRGISAPQFAIPALHLQVSKNIPAVPEPEPEKAIYRFNWLSATGTGLLLACVLSAWWMGVSAGTFLAVSWRTLRRMTIPLITIAAMLAIAFLTRYSGADVTLGLAFTHTGALYPFFAALLGWMGVALTGSDTSSNALFGSMQKFTAQRLGLSPYLICSANSTGGVMGKMIDAQSIVVASAATHQQGHESAVLRFVFWHSVILACLMGLLTLLQAYVLTWMVVE